MTDGPTHKQPGGKKGEKSGSVAYLDQTLWRQLSESEDQGEFLYAWLALQARIVEGVLKGVIVLGEPGRGPFTVAAVWPQGTVPQGALSDVMERVLETQKGVVTRGEAAEGEVESGTLQMGYPVRLSGQVAGAVGFEMAARSKEQLQPAMRQIQWGLAWVENWFLRTHVVGAGSTQSRITTALDLTAVTLQEKSFKASANALVTEMAARLDCDRVSLGTMQHNHVKVRALSHAAQFKQQMNLVRAIEAAMAECVDQAEPIVYPDPSDGEGLTVMRAHEELVSEVGEEAICSVPFLDDSGHGYGALTLERSPDKPFNEEEVELVDTLVSLVGPVLEEKRLNDRWLITRVRDSVKEGLARIVGPGHLVLKAVCAVGLAAVVFLSVAEGQYRVTAKTIIEGSVQMAVVSPYDGFLFEAPVTAGDTVKEGQVLCSLDDRDMKLERIRWTSQREQYQRQYREAMAEGNRANVKILREQISQAEAQINLLDEQLARSRMIAPFDGLVITGDLSQALGSPVQRGQVLFEIAPLQDYRLRLRVDEREINQIRPGQKGKLILNSLPETPLGMTISKVTPVAAAEEGNNLFMVEADLDETLPSLRPGMEGYGKVEVDRRKLIWIWTHDVYDWLRLWLWSWWP
jgi:RND family efflux transporter MFP subunit